MKTTLVRWALTLVCFYFAFILEVKGMQNLIYLGVLLALTVSIYSLKSFLDTRNALLLYGFFPVGESLKEEVRTIYLHRNETLFPFGVMFNFIFTIYLFWTGWFILGILNLCVVLVTGYTMILLMQLISIYGVDIQKRPEVSAKGVADSDNLVKENECIES